MPRRPRLWAARRPPCATRSSAFGASAKASTRRRSSSSLPRRARPRRSASSPRRSRRSSTASPSSSSFASVFVFPDIEEEIQIDIRDEDLRVDTYRSSGAGGQHVNKTDSAVRLTHLPSGIVVACQNERSQHKNKSMAMKVLKARLYELEKERQQEKMSELTKGKKEIGFGHQIRSYVLQPYRMVKDHRTNTEVGNADAVLDGELDAFIDAYLRSQMGGEKGAAAPSAS